LQKGEIFYHADFQFDNGGSAPKLLVLLNVPRNNSEPYLFCKTTSNPEKKIFQIGCQPDKHMFYIPKDTDFFNKNTWLELYYIAPFDAASVLKDSFSKLLTSKGKLKDLTIRQIVNCIKRIKLSEVKYKEMIMNS
jgi:hypothetical protein